MADQATEQQRAPGRVLSIVGIVFAVVIPIVGLILSLMARNRAKSAGVDDKLAIAGIVVSAIFIVLEMIAGAIATAAVFGSSR